MNLGKKLVAKAAYRSFRVIQDAQRFLWFSNRGLAGVLAGLFDPDERDWVTSFLYDSDGRYRRDYQHDWEEEFFRRHLSSPGSHVLVIGCGSGREMHLLKRLGHRVAGFDPAPGMIQDAQSLLPGAAIALGSLRSLIEAVEDGSGELSWLSSEHFDAVLFGWGVVQYTRTQGELVRVGRATRKLCPDGPWLGSYAQFTSTASSSGAFQFGFRTALRLRGAEPRSPESDLCFTPWGGFCRMVRPDDITSWAEAMDRRAEFEGFPGEHLRFALHRESRLKGKK